MKHYIQNKIIKKIKIAEDQKALLFICEDGEHVVKVDADCCSLSWIENVELPAGGFPCKVVSVNDLHLESKTVREDHDIYDDSVIAFYGCKITTDKGLIEIDYRNESNGYYGGNLSWPDDDFYGGAFEQNLSKMEWRKI
jgi:hypothetical protein